MITIKQRAVISGGIAGGVALVLALWPMTGWKEPPPTPVFVIANTWFGPLLLLVLPLLAVWVTFAANTPVGARLGFAISFALFVICLLAIWYANGLFRAYYGPIG
jgi:hypothetical protein